jgi:hypothetical protein
MDRLRVSRHVVWPVLLVVAVGFSMAEAARTTLTAGTIDSFAGGTEPASPSPELAAVLGPCGGVKDFDAVAQNMNVAHTFVELPARITGASLEVRVRANLSGSGQDGDGIILSTADPETASFGDAIVWLRNLGPSPGAPPGPCIVFNTADPGLVTPGTPWSPGAEATITLDLAPMPVI